MPEFHKVWLAEVEVRGRARALDQSAVKVLAESIKTMGLQTPISVRIVEDDRGETPVLIAGHHRLEAMRLLGMETAMCAVHDGDERDARLWEIAENLHRAGITSEERDQHIREWIALKDDKGGASPPLKGGGQPHDTGKKKAARELGIAPKTVREALSLGNLTEHAHEVIAQVGLNRKEQVEVAKAPAEHQPQRAREISDARSKPAPAIKNALESEEDWRRSLFTVWNRGAQDWRDRAMEAMDRPVFDRTAANG